MQCELCGKPASLRASIEGVTMSTCAACARFGTTFQAPANTVKKTVAAPEPLLTVVDDAGMKVKAGREKLGLTQQEFALKINEHQSVIHKIETGHHEPNIELARKLEKALHLTLIEAVENVTVTSEKDKAGPVTIGDMIKIKNA